MSTTDEREALIHALRSEPAAPVDARDGWKEAAIAWEVCASIHRQWAKGKDALFTTRQGDFVKHANDARALAHQAAAPVDTRDAA